MDSMCVHVSRAAPACMLSHIPKGGHACYISSYPTHGKGRPSYRSIVHEAPDMLHTLSEMPHM
eukprot:324334-Chlamydomonas_euryale.AAC.5